MLNRTNNWGPNPDLLTKGTPTEKSRYIIWMEFYESYPKVAFDNVQVVTLTDFGPMWSAYVLVNVDDALYRVRYYRGTNVIDIDVYDRTQDRSIKISKSD